MSTRSMLQFGQIDHKNEGRFQRSAQLYNHWDGYPEQRLLDIEKAILKAHGSYNTPGMTYRVEHTYPSDLAAFYVLANKEGAGNIEIDEHMHSDIEYLYQIWQDEDTAKFHVKILTTHQPEDEEFDPARMDDFWKDPQISKMNILDVGELDKLIEKYCKEEENG